MPEQEFVGQARTLFAAWHQHNHHQAIYQAFTALVEPLAVATYEQLPTKLGNDNGRQLLL